MWCLLRQIMNKNIIPRAINQQLLYSAETYTCVTILKENRDGEESILNFLALSLFISPEKGSYISSETTVMFLFII